MYIPLYTSFISQGPPRVHHRNMISGDASERFLAFLCQRYER